MELVFVEGKERNETVAKALSYISELRTAYDRNLSLLSRCDGERSEEADAYAAGMTAAAKGAQAAFCEASAAALARGFAEKTDEAEERLSSARLFSAVTCFVDTEDYIREASRLNEEKKGDGFCPSAYFAEKERAGFMSCLVFDAADAIRREACRLWKISLLGRCAGTAKAGEKEDGYRAECLSNIRRIFTVTYHAIVRYRECMDALKKGADIKETEHRMYGMCAARACAGCVIDGLQEQQEAHGRKEERNEDADMLSSIPEYFTAVHLDGGIEPFPSQREALAAMSGDLEMLSLCSCGAASEFLFASASDIASGSSCDREEALRTAGALEEESRKWLRTADETINWAISQSAEYIRDIFG